LLLAIVGIALGLRVYGFAKASFWGDELHALENSTGRGLAHLAIPGNVVVEPGPRATSLVGAPPWWSIWTSLDLDTHPPLHFVALRFWRRLFGEDEAGARSLSIVCSLLALLGLWAAVRSWHGTRAALWAGALMALSAAQIRYAQEARSYAFLFALAMAGMTSLAAIERRGASWPRLLALGASVLGMALTHYFCAGALLAMGAHAALALAGSTRRRVLTTLVAAGGLYGVVWGPFISLAMIGREQNPLLFERGGTCAICFVGRLLRLPAAYLGGDAAHVTAWAPLLGAVVWPVVGWLAIRRRRLRPWTFWLLGTVGAVALLDAARGSVHLFVIRYTLLASPGLFALLGAGCDDARSWLSRHGPPLAALVLEIAFLPHATDRIPASDWRALAADIDRDAGPRDVLLLVRSEREWSGRIYALALSHYLRTPRPVAILESAPSPELVDRLRAAPGVWLLAPPGERLDRVPGLRVVSVIRERDVPVLARLELDHR
jgi:mannosyltransferase